MKSPKKKFQREIKEYETTHIDEVLKRIVVPSVLKIADVGHDISPPPDFLPNSKPNSSHSLISQNDHISNSRNADGRKCMCNAHRRKAVLKTKPMQNTKVGLYGSKGRI
jgi:hypothetical protein